MLYTGHLKTEVFYEELWYRTRLTKIKYDQTTFRASFVRSFLVMFGTKVYDMDNTS